MKPTDAFVWLVEAVSVAGQSAWTPPGGSPAARPSHFSLDEFTPFECDNPPRWTFPHLGFHQLWFNDGGRVIGAYVVLGDQVGAQRQDDVWMFLDSIDFAGEEHRAAAPGTASPADCVTSGTDTTIVPSVLGQPLVTAIAVMQKVGLNVVGYGTPVVDPIGPTAKVRAQEPGPGERVPIGACVGFRTEG